MALIRICSWCQKKIGTKGTGPIEGRTDGICPRCKKEMDAKIEKLEKADGK